MSSNPHPQDCNHTFEKAAIDNHIKIAGNKEAKCPVAGCAKTVRRANLVPDDGMKRLVSTCDDRPCGSVVIQRGRCTYACYFFFLVKCRLAA